LEEQAALEEIARLETHMGGDPSASAFPALAEANRRAGRAKEAEQVAREGLQERPDLVAGRVALSLALLDLGRVDDARAELVRVLETVPDHVLAVKALEEAAPQEQAAIEKPAETSGPLDDLAEDELENAFLDAEAQPDEMLSANTVVAAAVRDIEQDKPEGVMPLSADSPFATETMADLLEQQDHHGDAQAVRQVLEPPEAPGTLAAGQGVALHDSTNHRARVIATLERWLENLRRGSR
jgi:tetratricopeptide (TPR) repeat protein